MDDATEARSASGAARTARGLALVIVVTAPVIGSSIGLIGFAEDWLSFSGLIRLVPTLVLDAATLYVASLVWDSVKAGEAAGFDRMLIWAYAGTSAGLNIWHGLGTPDGLPAAIFFGIASLSAALIWERTLKAIHRRRRIERNEVDPPAPKFRAMRWALAPRETFGAWKVGITEGIPQPRAALAAYRFPREGEPWLGRGIESSVEQPQQVEQETPAELEDVPKPKRKRSETVEFAVAEVRHSDYEGLTQRQAIIKGFEARAGRVHADIQPTRKWLAEEMGVKTDRSRSYKWLRDAGLIETEADMTVTPSIPASDQAPMPDAEQSEPHLVAVGQ